MADEDEYLKLQTEFIRWQRRAAARLRARGGGEESWTCYAGTAVIRVEPHPKYPDEMVPTVYWYEASSTPPEAEVDECLS